MKKKLKVGLKTYSGHIGPTKVKKWLKPKIFSLPSKRGRGQVVCVLTL
jgi:hypothetical protein